MSDLVKTLNTHYLSTRLICYPLQNASRVFARYNYTNKLDTTVSSVSSLSSTLSKSSQVSHPAGSSRKKTPANQLKKIDSTAVAKNGKKEIKTSTASASSNTSKNKLTLDTSSSKSKTASSSSTSKNKLTLDTSSSKSKISGTIKQSKAASSSKNNNSQKKKQESSNKNVVKKIIVTKTNSTENGTESDLQGTKNLKIQQASVKDSDPKLDEEVFVMLKEMKENFQRNKSPSRTTCYDSVEKVSRTRGKRLDASENSYTLDESGESTNATKHRNESTDTVKEVNALSSTKADTDKRSVASHVSVHLKDKSAKGDKRNSKKIKKNTNEKASDSSSEKSNVNKTEGKTPHDKDISKGRKKGILRELHSLIMPDSGNKNSQIDSRCYNTPNRVLRSKLRRGIKTVDYCESSEEDKKTKTKVGVTSEGSKDNPKIKTDKTKDANNKKESKNKNTNVNRRTKGKASSMGNERITDLSKEAGEEKVEKREETSVKNNEQKDSIQNRR